MSLADVVDAGHDGRRQDGEVHGLDGLQEVVGQPFVDLFQHVPAYTVLGVGRTQRIDEALVRPSRGERLIPGLFERTTE